MSRVVVVGLGYVGLPLAVRSAEAGHEVVGLDCDPGKISSLQAGRSHIEDITDERLAAVLSTGRLRPVLSQPGSGSSGPGFGIAELGFDVGVITVPTPLQDGKPNLSFVEDAARTLGRSLRRGGVVVLESTSYPGTTQGLVADAIFEESQLKPGDDYHLGFSPERIDPGNTVHTFETTPKIVSGTDGPALRKVEEFYAGLVERTVPVSSPAVAELAKLFENIFSQVNIALVNEMAMLAHELGIDVWEALDAADTKPHGFLKHTPGPGVGGHCIPIDPGYLSWFVHRELGRPFRLSELAQEINDAMPEYVVNRAIDLVGAAGLKGARVLLLGVAYKPGTGDTRESPALQIVRLLRQEGAQVTVADPHVRSWTETPVIDVDAVPAKAGEFTLVLVVTDHDEFDFDNIGRSARLVLDCRRRMTPSARVWSL